MTHQDPLNPRNTTRTTGMQPTDTQTPVQREVERKNFALLIGIVIAVLILVPLFVMWLWADDDGTGTVVAPELIEETNPVVADEGQTPAEQEAPQGEPAPAPVTGEPDGAAPGTTDGATPEGGATDVAPADGATTDTTP
jgi:hypothetical protein